MVDSVTHTSPPPSSNSSPSFYSLFGTSPPSHPDRNAMDHDDDELSPTQPYSLPGTPEVSGINNDNLGGELTDSLVNHDDDDILLSLDSSDNEMHCRIDKTNWTGVTVWEDADHHMEHTSDLRMDMLVDTSDQRALFVLQNFIYIKGSISSVPLYLFIYPEGIHSIEFDDCTRPPTLGMEDRSNNFIRLRFTLSQPPTLVFAKDRPLEPKNKSLGRLDVMKALAAVQVFDFYLDKFRLVPEMREQLALLPSIFSSTRARDRPKTDARRAGLQRLYAGAGGHILDIGIGLPAFNTSVSKAANSQPVQQTIEEEVVAPTYTKYGSLQSPAQVIITPSVRKRRRTSESLSPSTPDNKRIFTAFAQLAKSHAELQNRVVHLEKMLADSARCDHTPCRYDSEEAAHIIGHVNDKIDNDMLDVKIELEDQVLAETQQVMVEKTEEQQSQLWNDMREGLMDEMRQEIKEELMAELRQDLVAEVKMELFKDMAQAMMRAACDDDAKSAKVGTGLSQSTQSTDSTQ
ncbi:unnamed protein product [Sordaria macrospora k-hell]|uniref:WGS project CABT00000000 data, contig 2.3 n=2 Tax=Sordaria macrospora TaxID=5147 RepID=F7VQ51_SORMK|nr:uncharacterized protein SMAC_08118 [Sordaria macrospora k-hell]CCC07630.1 unnamed protein product [Sordaria macrospora k-hell]